MERHPAPVRTAAAVVRQDLEAGRHGAGTVKNSTPVLALVVGAGWLLQAAAQNAAVPVTVDNFIRAESDLYLGNAVKEAGGIGKLFHEREMASIDHQTVIRMNRDTLYSFGVFDLDAGPVTLALPDAGKRYLSVLLINEDHYNPDMFYAPGTFEITKQKVGTRYVCLAVRTFANPNDPADMKAVHALQDAIKVAQKSAGTFAVPNWDQESLKKMREALLSVVEANGGLDSSRMFGKK